MAKSGMEFSGYGSEIKEQPPHPIEGLVTSGFIDKSGQLTERTRRVLPRRGVEVIMPVHVQKCTTNPYLPERIQKPYRVVADEALFGGCLIAPDWGLQVEHKGHIFKRGYIAVCQDPTLVDIVKQLKSATRIDQHTKFTLQNMARLGLGSRVAGGGAWFEYQIGQLGRMIHNCPDNTIIDLDVIDKALTDESLQSTVDVDWFYDMSRFNAGFDFRIRGVLVDDIKRIFFTPRYNQATLRFASRYQEYQAACDEIQCEWEAREVRDSVGIPTRGYSRLKERKDHAHEFLLASLIRLFGDVRKTHDRLKEEEQQRQLRREFNATIERLTTVTEAEIEYQPAKVFHDELMRSLSGNVLMGFGEDEQDICIRAVKSAMEFIDKLPRMITSSLSVYEAYDHFQSKIKDMTNGKLVLPTTEQFGQKYPGIDQDVV